MNKNNPDTQEINEAFQLTFLPAMLLFCKQTETQFTHSMRTKSDAVAAMTQQ